MRAHSLSWVHVRYHGRTRTPFRRERCPSARGVIALATFVSCCWSLLLGCGSGNEPNVESVRITDRGPGIADALNGAGELAGAAVFGGHGHAAIWSDTGLVDLGTYVGDYSQAWGVNDSGDVVGVSGEWAVRWVRNPRFNRFDAYGFGSGVARDINNTGLAVGHNSGSAMLFPLDPSDSRRAPFGMLPTISGAAYTAAVSVSDADVITGVVQLVSGSGVTQAVVWKREADVWTMHELPGLPGGGNYTDSRGINTGGDVVGGAQDAQGVFRPVVWKMGPAGYSIQVLPLPPGATGGGAEGVNALGEVAGGYQTSDGPVGKAHAMAWTPDGQMVLLPELGGCGDYDCSSATDINDRGQISGHAFVGTEYHAVRWDLRPTSSVAR